MSLSKAKVGGTQLVALCYTCKNCNPLRCEWVREGKHVWKRSKSVVTVDGVRHRVTECDYYVPLGG